MLKRIWTDANNYQLAVDYIDKPAGYGRQMFWYCSRCSETYLKMHLPGKAWVGIPGICPDCPGDKWHPPGDITNIHLMDNPPPKEIYLRQINAELDFLSNPDHPHNRTPEHAY